MTTFSLRKLFSQTAVYGVSTVVSRSLSYLLVPFYTYVLSDPGHYGLLSELYSFASLFNILYLYGMETAYFRYAGKAQQQEPKLFGQLLGLLLLSSLLFSGLLYTFSDTLSRSLGYGKEGTLIQLMACVLALDAAVALPFARLRLQQKAIRFATLRFFGVGLTLGLNVFFLWLCPLAATGKWGESWQQFVSFYNPSTPLTYILLANLIASICYLPLLWQQWRHLRIDFQGLTSLLRYGLPLMGMGLVGMAIESVPRLLFRHLHSPSAQDLALKNLGSYAACAKLSVIIYLAMQAYRYAADPFMLSSKSTSSQRYQIANATSWLLVIGSCLCVGLALHADLLSLLLLQKAIYREALGVVPLLLLAQLGMGLYYSLSVWHKRLGKTEYGLYTNVLGLVVALSVCWIGVERWSYYSLAWSLLLAYVSMNVLCYIWGQKKYYMPYRLQRPLLSLIIGLPLLAFSPAFGWTILPKGATTILWLLYTIFCFLYTKRTLAK